MINFRGPLIRDLVGRGVTVYALSPDFDARTRKIIEKLGAIPVDISLQRTGQRVWRDVWDFVRLCRTIRALKPDAMFSYFVKPVIYGSLAGYICGVPKRYALVAGLGYVFADSPHVPSSGRTRRRILQGVVSALYRLACKSCDRVFFQNDDDVAYFLSNGLISRDKVVRVNGTGVDLHEFRPAPPVTKPITFLLIARLLREKGIREYVQAARKVKALHPSVRFLLVGAPDANPGALSPTEVASWVQHGIVEWPGHVDDVRPWISQSSVFVLPSYYREGVPRSTQEAMAMGRAVITTDSVGCRDTVQNGVNGFLVPPRDSEALADAMLRFVEVPSLIVEMGRKSREFVEQRFDVKAINALILTAMGFAAEPVPRQDWLGRGAAVVAGSDDGS